MIVPGSKAPLLGVRQPGYEMFAGIRACITETIRAPGYRSPLAERHPSAPVGSRAPWAKDLTNEETRELGRRLLCEAPLDFKDNDADEFVDILLSRIHPFTAWAAAAHACKERGIVSRTRHVLRAAENRGLNVGGLELAAELDERAAVLPEQLIVNAMRRSFAQGAGERARTLARSLNEGAWDDALAEFNDRAPDAASARMMHRTLISERTAAWLPRLEHDLAEGDMLVVVDVAHLAGATGLIARLGTRRFQVNSVSVVAEAT